MVDFAVQTTDLVVFLQRMGDNALILSHRASQWCGHAPALEEDIALANTALDLIGETRLWLELAAAVQGEGRSADDLAFKRDAGDFRNLLLVELPNRDFGFTLMRQFLFDAWHYPMLETLALAADERIAEIAAKTSKEAAYHFERSADLVVRLGDGSEESHGRMQDALARLWPYTGEMFELDTHDQSLIENGTIPQFASLQSAWHERVEGILHEATLERPATPAFQTGGRNGRHSEHLGYILAEIQYLQRAYPDARW